MATNSATLMTFIPSDSSPMGNSGPAPLFKRGVTSALSYDNQISVSTYFCSNLPRGTQGFTATTGIKVILAWKPSNFVLTGAVKWGVAFNLVGQTDTPNPEVDNYPLTGSANEITGTSNVSSTIVGGVVYTTISVPLASIKGANTTNPAGGDLYGLRVRRFSNVDAADTLAAPALLLNIELQDY